MRNHPRIIGFLGQALNHEYGAVQQYLTQASLCTLWGLRDWAETFLQESREELGHADLLNQRLLVMGIAPSGGQLRPPRPGRDLRDMLLHDVDLEAAAVDLYSEAEAFATRLRDPEAAALFARLRRDEEGHLQHLQESLAHLEGRG
ncbi:MAG: ferritin-like domain-containing protein [Gammaproteobacteria bacterium]|nr:ferritin-like domain-containing protein [Gammaproteobacteria bacterium]